MNEVCCGEPHGGPMAAPSWHSSIPITEYEEEAFERMTRGTLPATAVERKEIPIATGVLDYFPLAIVEIARISKAGNDQHHPGKSLHWDRVKSPDEADCLMRHFMERGTIDVDGQRHTAKMAWRALALLQKELEALL